MAIASAVYVLLYWHNESASASRMKRMMVSCGITEEALDNADRPLPIDVHAARSRCRNCTATDLCERWLAGAPMESADFCPNHRHFAMAARSSRT